MIRYHKGPAPRRLTDLAATPGSSWDALGAEDRNVIREALVRDQGALCAYCQRRIRTDRADTTGAVQMKIEHWIPRSESAEHHFRWTNLLGVCMGTTAAVDSAEPGPVRHCDTSRGNARLFLHPVAGQGPDPRAHVRYTGAGRIEADPADERVASDLRALNLNAAPLRRGREAVLDGIHRRLASLTRPQEVLAELRRLARAHEINSGVTAPEHAELVRYWVAKRIRRAAAGT